MRFRLASYNIRKCIGLDRRRDPGRVIDVLNNLDADIVTLQEADKRLGNRPAALPEAMLAEHSDYDVAEVDDTKGLGAHGNAILVRHGTKVRHVEALSLPGFEPRGAVVAKLETDAGPMRVTGVHLGLMRRHRRQQLQRLLSHLETEPVLPSIIAGDFNEWSETRGLEPLEEFIIHAPGQSYHAARPVASLDRIAHDKGFQLRDAGVDQSQRARRASDHLPVWVDLELGG